MVPISAKNLHKFCFQMGTGLRAGLDTLTCWKQCARLLGRSFDSRAEHVTTSLQNGVLLNESLSEHEKIIPPLVIQMIQIGELTGKTEVVFLDLAEYYKNQVELKQTFIKGIAWPVFELTIGLFVVGLLIAVYAMLGVKNPTTGEPISILGLSGWDGLKIYVSIIFVLLALLFATIQAIRHQLISPNSFLGVFMRIPLLSFPFRNIAMARFSWCLSMIHGAGVDAQRTVTMALRSSLNPIFTRHIKSVEQQITDGESFHAALDKTDEFSREFISVLEAGELSGTISETLDHQAKTFRRIAKTQFTMLTKVMGGLVFLIVGTLFVFMIWNLFQMYLSPINEALGGV